VEVAPGSGHVVYLPVPEEINLEYALLMRHLGDNQNTRNPHSPAAN
jgi:putative protease